MTNLTDTTRKELELLRQAREMLWREICEVAKLSKKKQAALESMLESWHKITKDIEEKQLALSVSETIDGWNE